MLTLREDWQSATSGAVVASLVGQLDTVRLCDEVATHLVGASLDLLVSTWPRRDQPPLTLETLSKSIWRISGMHYVYLRTNDDKTLSTCIKLSRSDVTTVVLPRRYEKLKRQLLTATLGGRTPCLWSLDEFISYRTLFATADRTWPPKRAILELFKAYNRRVSAVAGSDAMLVQVPQELA